MIEVDKPSFEVVSTLTPWVSSKNRMAAISSFGFSGTNAHVILEEGPEQMIAIEQTKPYYLITLSAKHPDSLHQKIED